MTRVAVDSDSKNVYSLAACGLLTSTATTTRLPQDKDTRTEPITWFTGEFAFLSNPEMAVKLLAMGERELIEGKTWRDTTRGCVLTRNGLWRGQNELGKILMRVRE